METTFDKTPVGADTMSPNMSSATNYYRWTVSAILPYVGENLLDIGGGFGAHLEHILPHCPKVTSIDISEESVQFLTHRFKDRSGFQARCIDFSQEGDDFDWLIHHQFDSITCLNVLEHIQDHITALHKMGRILAEKEGYLLLQVPALEWLYGSMDYQAGHYRRYSRRVLKGVLQKAGFRIERLFFFNSFGVLPWYINTRLMKADIDNQGVGLQITLFDRYIVPIVRLAESGIKPPIGQSLFAIARAGQAS